VGVGIASLSCQSSQLVHAKRHNVNTAFMRLLISSPLFGGSFTYGRLNTPRPVSAEH